MSWRDQLQPASFRGVAFLVEAAERSGGRRVAEHKFATRDGTFQEDLGRDGRGFPLEAFVLGDDYMAQRDRLISALEDQSGPGELVHPYYGRKQVICTSFRVRESTQEGRIARFSLELLETESEPRSPTVVPDPVSLLEASATAAAEASGVDFVATFDTDGVPEWGVETLAEVLTTLSNSTEEALGPLMESEQELAALKSQLNDLELNAAALVRQPQEVVDALADAFFALTRPVLIPRLLELYAWEAPARPEGTTVNRAREIANYDALMALVRRTMLIQAARLAPQASYTSYQEAVATRDSIAELLDEQLEAVGDDGYPALHQLRADLVTGVPGEESDLARVTSYTPPATVPSLVLAYRLYGDLDLEQDLVDRNSIGHPGFVKGEEELEVLSGG